MQKLTPEYLSGLKTKDVLSLDPAEHCGYHSVYDSGTKYFPNTETAPKKYGEDYGQMKNFRKWLCDFIEERHVKVLVSEALDGGGKSWLSMRKLAKFHGIIQEVTESYNIPIHYVNQKALKKWATGNGNADKQLMIEYCIKRWKREPVDDNEADAIHLFYHFCKLYKVRT